LVAVNYDGVPFRRPHGDVKIHRSEIESHFCGDVRALSVIWLVIHPISLALTPTKARGEMKALRFEYPGQ